MDDVRLFITQALAESFEKADEGSEISPRSVESNELSEWAATEISGLILWHERPNTVPAKTISLGHQMMLQYCCYTISYTFSSMKDLQLMAPLSNIFLNTFWAYSRLRCAIRGVCKGTLECNIFAC